MSHHDHSHDHSHGQPPPPLQVELDLEFPTQYRVVHYHEAAPDLVSVIDRSLRILEPLIMASLADVVPALVKAVADNQAIVADLRKKLADAVETAGLPVSQESSMADQLQALIDALDVTNAGTLPTDGGTTPTPTPGPTDGGANPVPTTPPTPTDTGTPGPAPVV